MALSGKFWNDMIEDSSLFFDSIRDLFIYIIGFFASVWNNQMVGVGSMAFIIGITILVVHVVRGNFAALPKPFIAILVVNGLCLLLAYFNQSIGQSSFFRGAYGVVSIAFLVVYVCTALAVNRSRG